MDVPNSGEGETRFHPVPAWVARLHGGDPVTRTVYRDRRDAGARLAQLLTTHAGRPETVVLGLTRGGVPVAFEIATALGLPLDVFVVRKLGVPGHDELAMGAVASGGVRVVNDDVVEALSIPDRVLDRIAEREREQLDRRELAYRGEHATLDVRGMTVILVDDGLATGSTMLAALEALRGRRPERIVVAVPTGSGRGCGALTGSADEVVCASQPEPFVAVGLSYRDFEPTSDDEVRALLDRARSGGSPGPGRAGVPFPYE